jgi:putative restriction endonuclease
VTPRPPDPGARGRKAREVPATTDEIRAAFAGIRTWSKAEQRAPHKPLLLLWALGNLQRGGPRLVEFPELEGPVRQLLGRYGHPRKYRHAEYPFWWLRQDGLWEVPLADGLPTRKSGGNPPVTVIRERRVEGGLPEPVARLLREKPALLAEVALGLLHEHFSPTLHEMILADTGLELRVASARNALPRDPAFARNVLEAYGHACAVCGYRAVLEDRSVGIDAAHIRWHCRAGPSTIDNGIALCALHHRLLDLGAFGLRSDLTLVVSPAFTERAEPALASRADRVIAAPKRGVAPPSPIHLAWHREEVFRGGVKDVG